jgi:hypothetical protein
VHLIDLCNRGDAASLFDELDEAGKRRTPRMDIKQQLRLYNGLHGLIAASRYEGVLRDTQQSPSINILSEQMYCLEKSH